MIWTTVDGSWWPDWFADLTTQDYFLWDHMKILIYETPEESEEDHCSACTQYVVNYVGIA